MMRPRERGFSLLEVVVASAVLLTGIVALVATMDFSMMAVRGENDLRTAALAASAKLEELRTLSPTEVCSRYRAGSARSSFEVRDLAGGSGRIVLHTNELESNGSLGLPRDLDGDGAVSNPDVSRDVVLLPVEVVVTWRGPAGARSITLATLIARKG